MTCKCRNVLSHERAFVHLYSCSNVRGCWAAGALTPPRLVPSKTEVRTRKIHPKTREFREFLTREGRVAGEYLKDDRRSHLP